MPTTTTDALVSSIAQASQTDNTQTYFRKVLLDRAEYHNSYGLWADTIPLPMNEGKHITVRRYSYLAPAMSALTQGVPPSGKTPTLTDYSASLVQQGDFIALTDVARWTQKDPVLAHFTGLLGDQEGYTIDSIDRDTVTAGTTVIYSNGTARTDVTSPFDGNDLDRMERVLMANGAGHVTGGTASSGDEGVYSQMPGWACVTHPYVLFTIQNLGSGAKKFRWPSEYKGKTAGEMGRYGMLAFHIAADPSSLGAGAKIFAGAGGSSTAVRNTAGVVDVYTITAFGKHGFSRVSLSGKSSSFHVHGLGTSGVYDPLDQVGTIGWKFIGARLRTNENWIVRAEGAAEL